MMLPFNIYRLPEAFDDLHRARPEAKALFEIHQAKCPNAPEHTPIKTFFTYEKACDYACDCVEDEFRDPVESPEEYIRVCPCAQAHLV